METIYFVALTPGMEQVAQREMRKLGMSFPIEVVSFEKGAEAVKTNPEADVFISRGLMVDLLKEHTEKPVVGLTMTIGEMLESVQRLVNNGAKKIGVVAHEGFLEMGNSDFQVGDVLVYVRPWSSLGEIPKILEQLKMVGIEAIAGDKGGSTAAQEKGYVVNVLDSGDLAIRQAILEAGKIAQAQARERNKEKKRREEFDLILEALYSNLEEAASFVEELSASSEELAATSQESNQIAKTTASEVDSVTKILDVIRRVAKQTNLLGLNAAIEAARAGEQGRGFMVVADEVRKLAVESENSAKDIEKMLLTFRHSVLRVQQNVEQSNVITGEQAQATQVLAQRLDHLMSVGGRLRDIT